MKLKDLITDENRALYQQVSSHFPVQLKKSDDGVWRSTLESKRILISHSKTKHPQAAFTHELLHIDTQLKGYRRLRAGVSLNHSVQEQLPFLCETIDNEFQHHKMYARFIELGYQSNEFYQDDDSLAEQYILNGIEAKGQSLTSITMVYFTLIAPGSAIAADRILALKEQFRKYDEGAFRERFDAIDSIVAAWKADASFHAEPYIIELMNVLASTDAWISYVPDATNFPGDGFFTSRSFTLEDITAAWAPGEK
jgi:hypothetical protein